MRRHPHLYEINTAPFLQRLSARARQQLSLALVPEEHWRLLAQRGFDLVWLMGVWQRSPGARLRALDDASLRREYDLALPCWKETDIAGSPYAIYSYTLDAALGAPDDLALVKGLLNSLGMGLVLDFVPNHLAFDHPWTLTHPQRFVQGREAVVRSHPEWFFSPDKEVYLAHGRDPNFPPWMDTVQVNFFSPDLRQALIAELLRIAEVADGVRCDMAMLALNEVFDKVWGWVVKEYPRPQTEFWTEAIAQVKRKRPGFVFLAEAYWGMERKLLQLGFDFTYDKALYDALRHCWAGDIRSRLMGETAFHEHSVHFIENHDEPRAVTAFGQERSLAAAAVIATVPGLRLFHDGQFEGKRTRLPVQLSRALEEASDPALQRFYERLLAICEASPFHEGQWGLIAPGPTWEGDQSHHHILAWYWRYAAQLKVVAVNYSAQPAQARLKLPVTFENVNKVILHDELADVTYLRDPKELGTLGLYVALEGYRAHIFNVALE